MRFIIQVFTVLSTFFLMASNLLAGESWVLAEQGKTDYVIGVAEDASKADLTAARQLKKYLELSTGAIFPEVTPSGHTGGSPVIWVGHSSESRELAPELDGNTLGADGIVIRNVGSDWVLAGGEPRGTLNAVFTFLQEQLGCRWYAHDAEDWIPKHEILTLEAIDQVYVPPFRLRWLYTVALRDGERADPLFAAKFRQNGGQREAAYGGGVGYGGAHTMEKWVLPASVFFEENPDWYGMTAEGKRIPNIPCYSSKEGLVVATKRVLEQIRKEYPSWQYDTDKIVSVSHPDVGRHCRCPDCLALFLKYDTHAASLLKYVNVIADAVADEYPDVIVSTLAYWGTAAPPIGMKARDNVLIHFGVANEVHHWNQGNRTLVVRDFSKPFQNNRVLADYLEGWTQIADNIYVWDYYTNFENMVQPYPTWESFPRSLTYYGHKGVSGVFAQGGWAPEGGFSQLKFWVASQMLWNPDQEPVILAKEFLDAYYGDAGQPLMNYLNLIGKAPGLLGSYEVCTRDWLTLEMLNEATLLFDEAEAFVVDQPEYLQRVRRARFGLDTVWVQRYRELQKTAQLEGKPFEGPENPVAELERLSKSGFGRGAYREWADFSKYFSILRELYPSRPEKAPAIVQQLKPHQWLEFQEESFVTKPEQATIINDLAASDNKALKVMPTQTEVVWTLPAKTSGPRGGLRTDFAGEWSVYLQLKYTERGEGILRLSDAKGVVAEVNVQGDAAFQLLYLGTHNLTEGVPMTFALKGSKGSMPPSWFIDRVILVNEAENLNQLERDGVL